MKNSNYGYIVIIGEKKLFETKLASWLFPFYRIITVILIFENSAEQITNFNPFTRKIHIQNSIMTMSYLEGFSTLFSMKNSSVVKNFNQPIIRNFSSSRYIIQTGLVKMTEQ